MNVDYGKLENHGLISIVLNEDDFAGNDSGTLEWHGVLPLIIRVPPIISYNLSSYATLLAASTKSEIAYSTLLETQITYPISYSTMQSTIHDLSTAGAFLEFLTNYNPTARNTVLDIIIDTMTAYVSQCRLTLDHDTEYSTMRHVSRDALVDYATRLPIGASQEAALAAFDRQVIVDTYGMIFAVIVPPDDAIQAQ